MPSTTSESKSLIENKKDDIHELVEPSEDNSEVGSVVEQEQSISVAEEDISISVSDNDKTKQYKSKRQRKIDDKTAKKDLYRKYVDAFISIR